MTGVVLQSENGVSSIFENLQILQRYDLREEIGVGGFGNVYRAASFDRNGKRVGSVAVKQMDKKNANFDSTRVKREIEIHGRLSHPNVVKLLDAMDTDAHIYIVTELCEFGDMRKYLSKNKRLSPAEAASVLHQVMSAVLYMHTNGYMHRDISTGNVLIAQSTPHTNAVPIYVKLGDFGLATTIANPGAPPRMNQQTICGTPDFMAPEMKSGNHSEFVDHWSLGVLLYTLLCGNDTFPSSGRPTQSGDMPNAAFSLITQLIKPNQGHRISLKVALQHEFFTPSGQTTRVTQYTNATSGADSGHGISLGGSAQGYAQRDYGRGTVASAPLTNQRRFPTADRRTDVNALLARRLPSTKQKAMAVFGNVASTSRPSPPTRTFSVNSTPPQMAQNHRLSQAPSRVRTASIGTPTRNLLSTERGMTVSKTTETTLPTITTRRLKHNIQNADSRFIMQITKSGAAQIEVFKTGSDQKILKFVIRVRPIKRESASDCQIDVFDRRSNGNIEIANANEVFERDLHTTITFRRELNAKYHQAYQQLAAYVKGRAALTPKLTQYSAHGTAFLMEDGSCKMSFRNGIKVTSPSADHADLTSNMPDAPDVHVRVGDRQAQIARMEWQQLSRLEHAAESISGSNENASDPFPAVYGTKTSAMDSPRAEPSVVYRRETVENAVPQRSTVRRNRSSSTRQRSRAVDDVENIPRSTARSTSKSSKSDLYVRNDHAALRLPNGTLVVIDGLHTNKETLVIVDANGARRECKLDSTPPLDAHLRDALLDRLHAERVPLSVRQHTSHS